MMITPSAGPWRQRPDGILSCTHNIVVCCKMINSCLIRQSAWTHLEEGDGKRKWTVVHHSEEIQRYDNIQYVCKASWTYWRGIFPPQRNGGCLFAVQFALLFSPHLVLSFFLILHFSGIFSFWSSKMRFFWKIFLLEHVQQNATQTFFFFILGASKHLNISAIFPWMQ